MSLSDPQAQAMLASYEIAVQKMLALPPSDPRNWYRNAFIHTLDCPHANWWFLPWHRGYLGWLEETCRALSGNSNFALPFWDWTAQPYVPARFWQGLLNPENPAFIASLGAFKDALFDPMSAFWKSLTAAQVEQLKKRGFSSFANVWSAVEQNPMFYPLKQARSLSQANPGFDPPTLKAVSQGTIDAALHAKDFVMFGSGIAPYHSRMVGLGVLEGQPHNLVHNTTGGFMGDFLSPVDPIFFAHHANIDRLWDVWTRRQQKLGLPTLPTGASLESWSKEPFLFYVDSAGQPAAKTTAGDYAMIDGFDYDYAPGSEDSALGMPHAAKVTTPRVITGTLGARAVAAVEMATATVHVPPSVLDEIVSPDTGPEMFARIVIDPPADTRGIGFNVLVNAPKDATTVRYDDPSYAGTIEFFGQTHHHDGPVFFILPLRQAVGSLRAANTLTPAEPLRIDVVPTSRNVALKALPTGRIGAVSVEVY